MSKESWGSVIVAHPGRQHSYRLASALKHAGFLSEYITTVYYKSPFSLLGLVSVVAPGDNRERILSRQNPDLSPDDVKQFYELRGILETLMWRARDVTNFRPFFEKTKDLFGIAVAKEAIKRRCDAVVCYEGNALSCFKYLEKNAPNITRVIDCSSTPRPYLRSVFEEIDCKFSYPHLRREESAVWDEARDAEIREEANLADYYLVASDFVAEGLRYIGFDSSRIMKLPYGCNFLTSLEDIRKRRTNSPIECLFVGQCVCRKGLETIARAFSDPTLRRVKLTVIGKYDNESPYVQVLKQNSNVKFLGLVSKEQVKKQCMSADLFILPTFTEGMSLACLEAMGSGLPIICTPNSGVGDLVAERNTGLLVEPGNVKELVSAINYFANDPSKCRAIGENAFRVASGYTWGRYEETAKRIFEIILKEGAGDK